MGAKIQGLEDLLKIAGDLQGTVNDLDKFVNLNKALIPNEHKHLLDGINTKSVAELEKLKNEIDKLGA